MASQLPARATWTMPTLLLWVLTLEPHKTKKHPAQIAIATVLFIDSGIGTLGLLLVALFGEVVWHCWRRLHHWGVSLENS